jgi:hypothetical protein
MVDLVANVIANLILVPTVGMEGAALAFLLTDVALPAAFYAALPNADATVIAAAPTPRPARWPAGRGSGAGAGCG